MSTKKTLLTNKFNEVQKEPHQIIEEQLAEEDKLMLEAETVAKKATKKRASKVKKKTLWEKVNEFTLDDYTIHEYMKAGKVIKYLTRGQVGEILNELYNEDGGWSYRIVQLEPKKPTGFICVVEVEIHCKNYHRIYQATASRDGSPEACETSAFKRAAAFAIPAYLTLWDDD